MMFERRALELPDEPFDVYTKYHENFWDKVLTTGVRTRLKKSASTYNQKMGLQSITLDDLTNNNGELWKLYMPLTPMINKPDEFYDHPKKQRGVKKVLRLWPELTDPLDPIIDGSATSLRTGIQDAERLKQRCPRGNSRTDPSGNSGNLGHAIRVLGACLAVINAESQRAQEEKEDARQIAKATAEICESLRDLPAEQRTLAQAPERVRKSVDRLERDPRLREKFLARLLERQGGHCALQLETCASIAVNYRPLTWSEVQVDHLLAVALGGNDDISNLQAVCPNCHFAKTAEDVKKICGPCGPPAKRARAE